MEFVKNTHPNEPFGLESAVANVIDRYDEPSNALCAFITAILARMPEHEVAQILTEAHSLAQWRVYTGR